MFMKGSRENKQGEQSFHSIHSFESNSNDFVCACVMTATKATIHNVEEDDKENKRIFLW